MLYEFTLLFSMLVLSISPLCHWSNETGRVRKKASNLGQMNSPSIISHKGDEASGRTSLLFTFSLVTFALEMRISTEEHFTPPLTSDSDWSAGWEEARAGPWSIGTQQRRKWPKIWKPPRHRCLTADESSESRYRGYSLAVEHFRTCFLPPKLAPYHKRMWRWKV